MSFPADDPSGHRPGRPRSSGASTAGSPSTQESWEEVPGHLFGALDRRDEALWRTRRLSWLVAGGAVTGSVVLGVFFAQALPGHAAPGAGRSAGGGSRAGSGSTLSGAGSATGQGAGSQGNSGGQGTGQAQPTPPPAPAPAPPQVVTGGS